MNQSANSSFDGTPMKENTVKQHQQGHNLSKRDQTIPDNEIPNVNGNFGSNVPPFPWMGSRDNDPVEQHYGPPGNGNKKIYLI